MGARQNAKTELFAQWKQGALVVADQGDATGNRFWVDSNTGTDAAGWGRSPDKPFDTLAYAFSSDGCTANNGDIIYVMEGHAEAPTTAITMDIAGVRVVGLGSGLTRPQITGGAASIDNITITAADITVKNLYFNEATVSAATANINIAAANATIDGCHMDMGANDRIGISITADGEKPRIVNCSFIVTADGPDSAIGIEGVIDMPVILNNYFEGSDGTSPFDDGCLDFSSAAVTGPIVIGNVFNGNDDATPLGAIVGESSCVGDCFSTNYYAGGCISDDTVASVTATLGAGSITAAVIATGAIDADAIADNAIDAGAIASDAITAAKIANGAIDAATFATDALTAIEGEAEDALEGENLDHLAKVAVDTNLATTVHANSVLGYLMGTTDMATYSRTTDSLETLGTVVAAILADTGTDGVALAAGSITSSVLAADCITNSEIANDAIDANAIADDALTAAKFDTGCLTADAFAADALAAATFATGAFTADAYAADALVAATFATNAFTSDVLDTTFTAEIADGVLDEVMNTTTHITAFSVGSVLSPITSGAAQASAAGTLVLAAATASAVDDFYNGCVAHVISGTGASQVRLITDYDQATDTCTVVPDWETTPGAGDVYVILPAGPTKVEAVGDETILGADNANNEFASTSVVANDDGSVIERLEGLRRVVSKTSATPLTTGTLFNYTGTVEIERFVGTITTEIAAAATTVQVYFNPDATGNVVLSTAGLDINAFDAGSILEVSGTAGEAILGTDGVDYLAPSVRDGSILLSSVTGGVIGVTYGAATAGAIRWSILWHPLSAGATLTAA